MLYCTYKIWATLKGMLKSLPIELLAHGVDVAEVWMLRCNAVWKRVEIDRDCGAINSKPQPRQEYLGFVKHL
jgi:hypothetical protein